MVDDFGPHSERHGGRLRQIQSLGRRGGLRFVDGAEPERLPLAKGNQIRKTGDFVHQGPAQATEAPRRGRGRPKFEGVRPWEAEGISRAEYFRRKKGGGGE